MVGNVLLLIINKKLTRLFIKAMMGGRPRLQANEYGTTLSRGFWVQLTSPDLKVYENYAVYDFNGIVGTVGGSLGLFIGFSVMEFMLMLIKIK